MAWVPLQESSVLHELEPRGLSAGTVALVDSRIVGTAAEMATWDYMAFLGLPAGTQFRLTVESFSCANPNPAPGTPSTDYKPGAPSIEWTAVPDLQVLINWAYPFSLTEGAPWPYEIAWPTDAPTVTAWEPENVATGTIGSSDPEAELGIGLWLFGAYVDATDNPQGMPTDFAILVEVWDEGGEGPGEEGDCFWTDLVVAEEDCTGEPPGEYQLSFLARRGLGGVLRTQVSDWCEPAFSLLTDALTSGEVQLSRVWPITTLAEDPLTFDFCGDTWTNPGIVAITDIALDGGGPLTLGASESSFSTSNEFIRDPTWFSSRCVFELTVNGTDTIYGYYDGIFTS